MKSLSMQKLLRRHKMGRKLSLFLKCALVPHADGRFCTKEQKRECWRKEEMKCTAPGFFIAFQSSKGTRGNGI